ncbi:oocyte-secreted protein 3-like [Acomys russatus]|uniref:oocyte-secreted protein 3-like n=1 Tax=Acomys russatus TaxID=60746 RepID=UPI0021E2952C|nr:oocyte-secreted protein 3-like [Acomys russatus]
MKAFVVSGLLLLLLVSGMWKYSGQQSVLVNCNYHNLHVIAKRTLFYQDELIGPDELFLGTGCQAVILRVDELEFIYPINFCGIVIETVADRTILYSWLTYKPKNKPISAELQLRCVIPRWAFLLSAGSRYNIDIAIVVAVPT